MLSVSEMPFAEKTLCNKDCLTGEAIQWAICIRTYMYDPIEIKFTIGSTLGCKYENAIFSEG